ncbi:MAG TPA: chemotaxis protein CheA [Candidatus Sulfotelmatobacter sp.]
MTDSSDDRGSEMRELFFETSQELVQALNEEALKLEKAPGDEEIVRSIRRTVHTLKGDSAACGLRELSALAHQFEDALSVEGASSLTAVAEIAFAAADIFAGMIAAYHAGEKPPDATELSQRIQKLTSAPAGKKPRRKKAPLCAPKAEQWTEYERHAMAQAQASGLAVFHIVAKIDPQCAMPIAGRQLIHKALGSTGQILVQRPDSNSPAPARQVEFVLASSAAIEKILAKARVPTIAEEVTADLLLAASPAPPLPEQTANIPEELSIAETATAKTSPVESHPAESAPAALENILRVDAARIDNVLNLVGELIIGKSMLQQALTDFSRRYPREPLRGKFADAIAFQARVLNDLQRSVMKIRMVPVEQLFRRFPRMVRDVALQCGRDVELVLSGQETDMDKGILDSIAEPLTHMVRNAISHGIESPDERRAAGKPAQGRIRLNSYHQGNQVVVEVSDDGRGIDVPRVRRKAVELGLVSAEEAKRISDAEALEFIFKAGFSTAEQITAVSGRGVGMDVVQSVLHRLKAAVSVETHAGQGTTFRLKLPLTLAIIKALLFWVEERLYAIALNAVVEISRVNDSEVHQVDNYEVLQLRNQVLPVLRLGRAKTESIGSKPRKLFVLVTALGEKKFGLIVDALEGEEELVIKALDDHTFATDLVSGASILGDGRVVLILNLPAIVEHSVRSRPQQAGMVNSGLLLTAADRYTPKPDLAGGTA